MLETSVLRKILGTYTRKYTKNKTKSHTKLCGAVISKIFPALVKSVIYI